MSPTVAVLGGGVAGMTCAHELAERGFDVTVFETRSLPGGKARSMPVEGTGTRGRPDLPGEHGFRFFPGFYRHVPDTMSRIPSGTGSVFDALRAADEFRIARAGRRELIGPARFPETFDDLADGLRFLWDYATTVGVSPAEAAFFVNRLLLLLSSCEARRYAEYEQQSWWEFSGAASRSTAYQQFLADGLTRSLVAARARELSARTGGYILLQLMFDLGRPGGRVDRVLSGPTNDVWITPWLEHLRSLGVTYLLDHDVPGAARRRLADHGVTVASSGGARRVEADRYVCALPVEQVRMLLSPALRAADPALDRLDHLVTRWMNGIMFYLDTDVRGVRGHTIYIDSEWSLTSVSQQQFWDVDITSMGDGRVEGILSVDISEWNRPGRNGRPAMKCSRQEICDEVWAELEAHLDDDARKELDRANVVTWFLDPAIRFPNPTAATNLEPLLVNTAGSWADRPDAGPAQRAKAHARAIGNLYLAADYVRTHTDLATMEGANEAARRAVNEVLDDEGSGDERCDVWPLHEPELFAPARALDLVLFKLGLDPRRPAEITPDGRVDRAGTLEATALAGADLFARLLR